MSEPLQFILRYLNSCFCCFCCFCCCSCCSCCCRCCLSVVASCKEPSLLKKESVLTGDCASIAKGGWCWRSPCDFRKRVVEKGQACRATSTRCGQQPHMHAIVYFSIPIIILIDHRLHHHYRHDLFLSSLKERSEKYISGTLGSLQICAQPCKW